MGFAKALVDALAAALQSGVAGLTAVYSEWPEKNVSVAMPSISVMSSEPRYERCSPYLKSIGAVSSNQAVTTYVVGGYDVVMQLDIWTKYKPQRDQILDAVTKLLQPVTGRGYVLQLASYFNEYVTFAMTGYKFHDNEDEVSRKQWRCSVAVVAQCRAINTTSEYIIINPVLQFETPNNIP